MKGKVAILFAGLALLSASPVQAQNAVWQSNAPLAETAEFEAQEVGFKRKGFGRRSFGRRSFRRGGFRRSGIKRGFKNRSFGRRKFNSRFRAPFKSFGHSSRFRRFDRFGRFNRFGHSSRFRKVDRFGRFSRFGRFNRFGKFNHFGHDRHFSDFDKGLDHSESIEPNSEFLEEQEVQSPELIEQPIDESLNVPLEDDLQAADSFPNSEVTFVEGTPSADLDPDELFTEGIQDLTPEEVLGIELQLDEPLETELQGNDLQ